MKTSSIKAIRRTDDPAINPSFFLAIDFLPVIKQTPTDGSLQLKPKAYVTVTDDFLTFSTEQLDASAFSLQTGQITTNAGSEQWYTTTPEFILGYSPIRVGIAGIEDASTTFSLYDNGVQKILVWDTRRIPVGTASAQFCAVVDSATSGRIYVFWDCIAPERCTMVVIFVPDGVIRD
ncbi:hypothetical protein H072_5285 [Dactylellina haptotyla CBS 200.50]|uniref:DUF7908 domain-containing protein n=1 Tax=Dactylellina haptotyla (strain CBS 200.50) TaxID=1284197 RepID=S8BN34_DACHA|nr:hypothetical protein H072_5285 [Dactylellina haptotyla CBS 200.50]